MFKYLTGLSLRTYWQIKASPTCGMAYARNYFGQKHYPQLTEEALKATRTSDTAFIFGSGYSLNRITPEQWQWIAQHNTISFRDFPRQNFIRADYHLTAEVDELDPYAARLRENSHYAHTVFVVQKGWSAWNGNNLIGRRLLQNTALTFRFHRKRSAPDALPSRTFSEGLFHTFNSSFSVVNFAYLMGWKHIVLAGIDLNDKRYFWLKPDETRTYEKSGLSYQHIFPKADKIVALHGKWTKWLSREGVHVYTLNPKSLLAQVMPVYTLPVHIPESIQ